MELKSSATNPFEMDSDDETEADAADADDEDEVGVEAVR